MLANKIDTLSFTVSRENNIQYIMILLFVIGQPFAGKLHLINFYSFFKYRVTKFTKDNFNFMFG